VQRILQTIKYGLLTLMVALPLAMSTAPATQALSNDSAKDQICGGLNGAGTGCGGNSGSSVQKVIKVAINILSIVAGIAAVIMIIVGGLKYITSGGDPSQVGSAKNTVIYAVVGIVVVAVAQGIVQFVLDKV
jgi:hypothetical protein